MMGPLFFGACSTGGKLGRDLGLSGTERRELQPCRRSVSKRCLVVGGEGKYILLFLCDGR